MAVSDGLRLAGSKVLVLQHLPDDGPAFLGQWLDEQGVSYQSVETYTLVPKG